MPRRTQETDKRHILPLPDKGSPDYFRALVRNCILAYAKFTNDGLSLDYCKVTDQKLRAMVLADEEYRCETKSIYAQQRLAEIEEIENLDRLAANEDDDHGEDTTIEDDDPRNDGKPKKKRKSLDKDTLNMRFKAAQLKREIRADMASASRDAERDAANFMFIPITQEDFRQTLEVEIHAGDTEADMDSLVSQKEEMPDGTSGKLRNRGRAQQADDEPFEEVLESGEIVEL